MVLHFWNLVVLSVTIATWDGDIDVGEVILDHFLEVPFHFVS